MTWSEILASGWPPVSRLARADRLEYAAICAWELTAPGVRSRARAGVFAWQVRFMLVSLLLARERAPVLVSQPACSPDCVIRALVECFCGTCLLSTAISFVVSVLFFAFDLWVVAQI